MNFDTRHLEKMARGLRRLVEHAPLVAGNQFVAQVREFAASQRNPDGTPFKPLTKQYAKRKAAKGLPPIPNLRVTGGLLQSVKNRSSLVGPDEQHTPQAKGLAKKRTSFEPSPLTVVNIERLLLREFNAI